ncbi:MAG: SAM-dependent methyltransferase [Polyangiaceae bacterium]
MNDRTLFLSAAAVILSACGGAPPAPPAPPANTTTAAVTPTVPEKTAPAAVVEAPAKAKIVVPPAIQAIIDAPDRTPEDKALDAGRHPGEMLAFFGVAPGMKVAEIAAGGGYTTELLARAVGPKGVVYGQNSKFVLQRYAEKPWTERLARPVMKGVVRVNRDFDDPLPPQARDLDLVIDVLFYHDTYWQEGTGPDHKVDRAKMNKAVFQALKSGGIYGIVDHSGKAGTGSTEVSTLHRIEEKLEREEIEKAGFKLVADADFLRNPNDTRDWNDSPRAAADKRGTSDRFVLKFVKP